MITGTWTSRLTLVGSFVLRYSLVFFLLMFDAAKFTAQEATGIQPMMAHSPLLFWVDPLLGVQGGSDLIGCMELTIGMSIALRRFRPFPSACGSLWAAGMFLIALSFLFTIPGLDPQGPDTGFLLKDLTLVGGWLSLRRAALRGHRPSLRGQPPLPLRGLSARWRGAAFVTWASFVPAAFRFTAGKFATVEWAGRRRTFCARRGSPLTFVAGANVGGC